MINRKNRNIRLEIKKNRIVEYSLLSGRILAVLYIFDNTYNYQGKKIFFEAYSKAYYKRG